MSRRRTRSHNITTQPAKRASQALTTRPQAPAAHVPSPVASGAEPVSRAGPILFGVGLLLVAGIAVVVAWRTGRSPAPERADLGPAKRQLTREQLRQRAEFEKVYGQLPPPSAKWAPPAWAPATEKENVLDRFVKLRNAGDPSAEQLLPRKEGLPEQPVPEAEWLRLSLDRALREPGLKVAHVCRGEPDGEGGLKDVPGRWTLVTSGSFSGPPFSVREPDGRVSVNCQKHYSDSAVIVEVKGGKVHGVRAEQSTFNR
jgi:hypothetical protein